MPRAIRWPLAFLCAVPLGVYLTLAGMQPMDGTAPDDTAYTVIGMLGIAGLVLAFGWPGVIALPFVTVTFASVYEQYFWDRPEGLPEPGMDYIAYYPSSIGFVMFFAVPYACVLMLPRTAVLWLGARRARR